MKSLIEQEHTRLLAAGKTVAAAESCTGGLLSVLLTGLSGSSRYFKLGVVAYSNAAKTILLGIPQKVILTYGAVSRPVAVAMGQSVRTRARSDYGLGITGIAGPTGAVKGKPVGTVFIAASDGTLTRCKRYSFRGTRHAIRNQSAKQALRMLLELIR